MPDSSNSLIGKQNKNAHAKAKDILVLLKGKNINTLTPKETTDLLILLAILLKVADKDGVIK